MTVYALSEDTARDAHEVVASLVRASLRLVGPGARLDGLRFEPDEAGHAAVKANRWKSAARKDHRHRVDLVRTLATNVTRADCLVVFHFDGDTTWAERDRSENERKFRDDLLLSVERVLHEKGLTPERAQLALRRLVSFVPHYTMESWLYQSTEAAISRCRELHAAADIAHFEGWARDRTALDEIEQPWKLVALHKAHNATLAASFPAPEVYAVGKSYAALVDRLRGHEFLLAWLRWSATDGARHGG
ncbi:MAG: hypothetical protein U0324_29460 [Polyangiales bacterium]